MLTITKRAPRSPENARSRTMLVSNCCSRASAVTFSSAKVRVVDDAVRAEAVTNLEALDRGLDEGIESRAHPGHRIEIARGDQALPQRLHRLRLAADLEFGAGRHRVPSAPRDHALIDLDRRLGRRDRVGRKHRRRLATDGNPLGGLVALRPFGLISSPSWARAPRAPSAPPRRTRKRRRRKEKRVGRRAKRPIPFIARPSLIP